MKRSLKLALIFLILGGTVTAFILYARSNPEVISKIGDIEPGMMVVLMGLFALWFLSLVLILRVTLRLFSKSMSFQENLLLNAYSSLVNFFGPGQSGPAFRAVYLKKRHDLKIKHYVFGTLLYYGFYAVMSAFLLLVGSRPWWQTTLVMVAAAVFSVAVIRWYAKRSKLKDEPGVNLVNLGWLFLFTAFQAVVQVGIYAVELHSVSPGVSLAQILSYTGAANFALFVSLTPGAIGIREAFLVFSQNLHHLGNSVIVAANIIDRAAYLLFLGLLFIMVIVFHAKDKLKVATVRQGDS
jgi:uncharacterized membrane protein YbhN (UPF0104 family)